MIVASHAVVEAFKDTNAERQGVLAKELAQMEEAMRGKNAAEVADFIDVLRAMLAGEDVTDKIAALVEPFKGIAAQTQAALK